MTIDKAFFDRRAAIAALLVCPLGAILALVAESCVVSLFLALIGMNVEPPSVIGPMMLGLAVILFCSVTSACTLLPLMTNFRFLRPPRFVGVIVPVFALASTFSTVATIGLWWIGAESWRMLILTYGLFVVPPTSAAIMYHVTYHWLARRHPDE